MDVYSALAAQSLKYHLDDGVWRDDNPNNCCQKGMLKAISGLSEESQKILRLLYEQGMTLAEAGKAVGLSGSRICSLRDRIFRNLRREKMMMLYKIDFVELQRNAALENLERAQNMFAYYEKLLNEMKGNV